MPLSDKSELDYVFVIYKTVVCWLNGSTFLILNLSEYQVQYLFATNELW